MTGNWIIGKTKKITKDYTLGKQMLGDKGAFGYAVKAIRKSDKKEFAVKVISKTNIMPTEIENFRAEIEVMQRLDHPNIIAGEAAYEDKRKLYLVMELMTGGELFDRICELTQQHEGQYGYSEQHAASILKQLLLGLKHMHDNEIAHCDLKPDNFLFDSKDSDVVKIIDFGMAKYTTMRSELHDLRGTVFFMAPEVLAKNYTYHCDMWSMGVVMFTMLFGFYPFEWKDNSMEPDELDIKTSELICRGFVPEVKSGHGNWFPANIPISTDAKDLIQHLLELDVMLRLTVDEALAHPWFNGGASSEPLVASMAHNLANISQNYQLKNLLLSTLTQGFSDLELAQLRTAFEELDVDGDGKVTLAEMKQVLEQKSSSTAFEEMKKLMTLGDMDGDGYLSYEELVMAARHRKLIAKEERLMHIFSMLDANGDGHLTLDEIQQALGDHEGLIDMIEEVDRDGDGTLDYEEFVEVFMARERATMTGSTN